MLPVKRLALLLGLVATAAVAAVPSQPPFKTSKLYVDTVTNQADTAAPVLSAPLLVPSGGTGASSLTGNGVLYGGGTGAVAATAACTGANTVLRAGSPPTCSALVNADLPTTISSKTLTSDTVSSAGLGFSGSSSGTTTLAAPATAGGTSTLPGASTTLAGLGIAETFSAAQTYSAAIVANAGVTLTGGDTVNYANHDASSTYTFRHYTVPTAVGGTDCGGSDATGRPIYITKIGNMVALYVNPGGAAGTSTCTTQKTTAAIPSQYFPSAAAVTVACQIIQNGVREIGAMTITTAGFVYFQRVGSSTYGGSGTSGGWDNCSASYYTAN